MLIFSLIFKVCGESLSSVSGKGGTVKEEINLIIYNQPDNRHAILESECHIMNEWLNRKSMGNFIKTHIALESGISSFEKKTHFNDTFIP